MGTLEIKCFSGDPWSPSGMGDGDTATLYSVATETFDVTEDTDTLQLWFAGKGSGCSGPRTTLIASAYITQDGKSTPVSVRGQYSNFVVPSTGCWSDAVSVADFTLPGTVSFIVNYVEATNVPTFSDNAVPTDPVPVSAVDCSPEENIDYNAANTDIVLDDDCNNVDGWTIEGGGTASASDGGILLDSGIDDGYVTIIKTLDWCPDLGSLQVTLNILSLNTLVSQMNIVMGIGNKLTDASDASIYVEWCSDGLYVYNGSIFDNMGNVVTTGDQTWKFVFDTRNGSEHSINVYEVIDGADVYINSTTISMDGSAFAKRTLRFAQAGDTGYSHQQAIIKDIYYTGTPGYNRLPFQDRFDYEYSGWEYVVDGDYSHSLSSGKLNMSCGTTGYVAAMKEIVLPSPISICTVEFKIKCNELPATFVNDGNGENSFYIVISNGEDIHTWILISSSGIYFLTNKIGDVTTGEDYTISVELDSTGTPTQRIYVNNVLCDERTVAISTVSDSMPVFIFANVGAGTPTESIDIDLDYILIHEGIGSGTSNILDETPQTGTATINANPSPLETFTVSNSATTIFTFVNYYPLKATEIQIGATAADTAVNLAAAINKISGAEFLAEVDDSTITVTAYCESAFAMTTTSAGIEISTISQTIAGLITESTTVADSFTASEGGKAIQENASAADNTDGLIDGLSESASATALIDCLTDSMDENANASAATDNFDGLIEYMGEEVA